MEKVITQGDVTSTDYGNSVKVTKYSINGTTEAGCFIVNANQYINETVNFKGSDYFFPAQSISVLP